MFYLCINLSQLLTAYIQSFAAALVLVQLFTFGSVLVQLLIYSEYISTSIFVQPFIFKLKSASISVLV